MNVTFSSFVSHRSRRGLTLIELLVVAFILVLFVAVAAPLMKPPTADRKVREAARQLNAYIAEAKAFAAQRGRPVGLAFDRAFATTEAGRNSNIITRMYLAQSPPHYTGDLLTAQVSVTLLGDRTDPIVAALPTPPWFINDIVPPTIWLNPNDGNGSTKQRAKWYKLGFDSQSAMLNVIIDSYIPESAPTGFVPFRIRLANKGTFYDGYVQYANGSPRTYNYYCWAPYGTVGFSSAIPSTAAYEIEFFPQMSTDSPLELPTGSVVDLQFSGFGQSGNQFNDPLGSDSVNANKTPVILVFSPSGEVEQVVSGGTMTNQLSRIHFLVGTLAKAVDSSSTSGVNMPISNIADPINQWVSLNTRTGHVTTADNLPPTDFTTVNTAVQQARGFATGLNTKGGR